MLQRTIYMIMLALLLAQQHAVLVGTVQAASETTSTYDEAKSPRGRVSTLSAAALKQALQQHKYLLVDFMAPWCGHCQQLAPEFRRAAEELGDMQSDLRLAEVDVTQHSSVQAEYGIAGFPTLKWFVNGKESRLTVEARSAEELVAFCTKNSEDGPVASTEKLKDKLSDDDKSKAEKAIEDALAWLESNQLAEKEEFEHKQKEVEGICTVHGESDVDAAGFYWTADDCCDPFWWSGYGRRLEGTFASLGANGLYIDQRPPLSRAVWAQAARVETMQAQVLHLHVARKHI